jgi:GMP synthase (glutamine-hydrolysing)
MIWISILTKEIFMRDYKAFAENAVNNIRLTVGDSRVLCAFSGGLDSAVAATLVQLAIGDKLICIFVDHGLMRKDEGDMIVNAFGHLNLTRVNADELFLNALKGVTDPEQKRKIIGEQFIRVFESEAKNFGHIEYLCQGTIYPDIAESGTDKNPVIKSHHNVAGLPDVMDFSGIIEPVRDLYKQEVRELARELGLPDAIVNRQPFPGPGLAVRCLGEVTEPKLMILRECDSIFRYEMEQANIDASQTFAVITGLRSVGVKNGKRTFDYTIALRAVKTIDFMSAEWVRVPYDVLNKASGRILSEVEGVNRIVYDITSKPPSTIEWE